MSYLYTLLEAYHRSPIVALVVFGHNVIDILIAIIGDAFSKKKGQMS